MKIQVNQKHPLYFSADLHISHANIIKYAHRPFYDVDEMNEKLIENWNKKVPINSTVVHLGDFCFSSNTFKEFSYRLNGNIIWIKGNHDKFPEGVKFYDVAEFNYNGIQFFCSHYAHRVWNKSHFGTYHLYGHSHGTLPDDPNSLSMDVGIDCNKNYEPFSFEEIMDIMKTKTFKPIDHHGE